MTPVFRILEHARLNGQSRLKSSQLWVESLNFLQTAFELSNFLSTQFIMFSPNFQFCTQFIPIQKIQTTSRSTRYVYPGCMVEICYTLAYRSRLLHTNSPSTIFRRNRRCYMGNTVSLSDRPQLSCDFLASEKINQPHVDSPTFPLQLGKARLLWQNNSNELVHADIDWTLAHQYIELMRNLGQDIRQLDDNEIRLNSRAFTGCHQPDKMPRKSARSSMRESSVNSDHLSELWSYVALVALLFILCNLAGYFRVLLIAGFHMFILLLLHLLLH